MTRGSKRLRRASIALGAAVVLAGCLALGLWQWLDSEYRAPGPAAAASRIEVPPGTSVRSALRRLERQGAVRDARAVHWYLRRSEERRVGKECRL